MVYSLRLLSFAAVVIAVLAASQQRILAASDLTQQCAAQILKHQTTDGALAMSAVSSSSADVVPYFSNLSAIGLIAAYNKTHDASFRSAAQKWVIWFEMHLNTDGTIFDYQGIPGSWKSTGKYDSVDSYAATYIELVWQIHVCTHDKKWLAARDPYIKQALGAIRSVMQAKGLTIARRDYPVMYTMDNVETLRGLRAAAKIENAIGNLETSQRIDADAAAMEAAISRELWDPVHLCYRVDIQTDGGKEEGLDKWYPNKMANLMAAAWLPPSSRNRELFDRLYQQFQKDLPTAIRNWDDQEHLVWWALAANGTGNEAVLRNIKNLLGSSQTTIIQIDNLAMLGHICRL